MDMTGETRLNASREKVWAALNDADVLGRAIPGCEEINKLSDTEMTARVQVKIGPIKARFNGKVMLGDLVPPESYRISGEGQGGIAGFAKGAADVMLEAVGPEETILRYKVHATVGGKIAQLGSRLIDATAKKMAAEFFDKFGAIVNGDGEAAPQA